MVLKLRGQRNLARIAGTLIVAVLAWSVPVEVLQAEAPPVHYNHAGIMPPGAIGSQQLLRGGPLPGYFQPVEIKAPPGALISTAASGQFENPQLAPMKAGMLIGSVYRLRITSIPRQEGLEVYPTIEVIDRLYPPVGQEFRFPILIDLTQDELELALDGKFVTRVIYLEEPEAALSVAQKPDDQTCFEVADGENPLEVADSLGRPMAILRMGGRLPDVGGADDSFLYGSPPMLQWKPSARQGTTSGPEPLASRLRIKQTSATSPARKPLIVRGPIAP
jgi:hypothetical protein